MSGHSNSRAAQAAWGRHAPAVVALAAYWMATGVLVWHSLRLNAGHLAYALDDPYIHMAMAKNVVLHGVWGVTPYAFTSTSSSPLWTALLAAAFGLAGIHDYVPLLLNLVAGSISVIVVHSMVRSGGAGAAWTGTVLLAFVFGSALPTLALVGMEHTLHGLVTLVCVTTCCRVASAAQPTSRVQYVLLAGVSAAVATVRYEGLFAAAVLVALLVFSGKRAAGVVVGIAALAPVGAYGLWSAAQGWYVLPNSVILKGAAPEASLMGAAKLVAWWNAANALVLSPHLLVLVAASLAAIAWHRPRGPRSLLALNITFVAMTLLHVQFAKVGWFFRYEAYLLMVGIAVLGATAGGWVRPGLLRVEDLGRTAALALLVAVAATPVGVRAVRAIQASSGITKVTHDQQYQMGLFLQRFYAGRTVAVNDIGAVNYLADVRLLDLVGLASMDVARLRRAGIYTHERMADLARQHHVDIAIVYDSWLLENGGVPPAWRKVGEWTGTVPDSTVAFYAVGPGQADGLRLNLAAFAPALPPGVTARDMLVP